jgi:hypothetical protein
MIFSEKARLTLKVCHKMPLAEHTSSNFNYIRRLELSGNSGALLGWDVRCSHAAVPSRRSAGLRFHRHVQL